MTLMYSRIRFVDASGVIYYEWVTAQDGLGIVCRTPEAL